MGKLLKTRDLVDKLGVPESTLRYWRHIGEGPPGFRLGRAVVYDEADVDAWVEAQKTAERAPARA